MLYGLMKVTFTTGRFGLSPASSFAPLLGPAAELLDPTVAGWEMIFNRLLLSFFFLYNITVLQLSPLSHPVVVRFYTRCLGVWLIDSNSAALLS